MNLSRPAEELIVHWGEMGTRWGINRTVAQIHALLFLSSEPLHAEQISETLSVARSNVSTSLKELQGWRLVRVTHVLGDRRDHFEALGDSWEMFETILEERKRREIDPTIAVLRRCLDHAHQDAATAPHTRSKIADILTFMETVDAWYGQMRRLPRKAQARLFKLGRKLRAMLGAA